MAALIVRLGPVRKPPMLAHAWDDDSDPTGWWLSEKYDGVRALWDGAELRTRNDHVIHAPESLLQHLPNLPLDGELWTGRGNFQQTAGIVRSKDHRPEWDAIKFVAFDLPAHAGAFETRQAALRALPGTARLLIAEQTLCQSKSHLRRVMQAIVADGGEGGEGVMLRRPGSAYEAGRSHAMRKLKYTADADGVVTGFTLGTGRCTGRVGALLVRIDGNIVRVGAGLPDAVRDSPPPLGAHVIVAHSGVTRAGMLREPRFIGERADYAEAC